MPGQPGLGKEIYARLEERKRLEAEAGKPEVIGEIKAIPASETPGVQWQAEGGSAMTMAEPPPPWEMEDEQYTASDAHRYVDTPESWVLRWINPRLLESQGWRYWTAISAHDSRVKVKVESMIAPDGTVRRGGTAQGDILAWMYRSWVESRRKLHAEETARLTQSAIDRQNRLREEFARGAYGPYVGLESAHHPTHTMAEGRSLKQDV